MALTVLYDADCGFCRWSVAQLLAIDRGGRLRPRAIQSEEGQRLLAGLPPAARLATAHVVGQDGRVASGGDAVALIAAEHGRAAGAIAAALAPLSRGGYRLVSSRRGTFGRLVSPRMRAAADARIAAREV